MMQYPPPSSPVPMSGSAQVVSAVDLSCQPVPYSPAPGQLSYAYLSLLLSTLLTGLLSLYFLLCAMALVSCLVEAVSTGRTGRPQLLIGVSVSLMLTLFHSLFYLQHVAASTKPRTYSSYFRILAVASCRLLSRDPHHRLLYLYWYQHGLLSHLLRLDLLSLFITVLPVSSVTPPGQAQDGSGVLDWLSEILAYASGAVYGLFAAELLLTVCARCSRRRSSDARAAALWQKGAVAPTVRWQTQPLLPAEAMMSSEHSGPPPAYAETEEEKEQQQQGPQQQQRVRAEGEAEWQREWAPQAELQHTGEEWTTAPTVLMSPLSDERPHEDPPAADLTAPRLILSPAMQDDVDDSRLQPLSQRQQQRDPVPQHAVVRMSAA